MRNIIWKRPSDGGISVTEMTEEATGESAALAAELQRRGDIPPEWQAVAFDIELPSDRYWRAAWAWTTDDPSIDIDMSTAQAGVVAVAHRTAKGRLDALISGISPGEMAPWLALEEEARRYLADPTSSQIGPNMQAELGDRAPAELARSIVAKADALRSARAAIVNARRRHVLTIKSIASSEELKAYDMAAGWPK